MKAISLRQPQQFEKIEIAEPGSPGPGEALVRVHRVGICGSDISGYLGKMPFYSYPRIPGHELGVEVLAVGAGVSNVAPGDRCSVEPYINCEKCFACRRGGSNCCEKLEVLGVHRDGGLRPRFILPARKLHRAGSLSWDQIPLVETLAIGCHAVNRAAPTKDDTFLVIGAGPIGLSVIEFVKLSGAKLIVIDMNEQRLAFCRERMGVAHTILATPDGAELKALTDLTDGALASIVCDATGSPKSMCNAFNFVGHTGKLVFVGIVTTEISFSDPLLHRREMTVYGSRNAMPEDFPRIIKLIESGQIDTRPWITHHTPFDQLIEVFPSYTRPETGVIKAIVEIDADKIAEVDA